MTIDKASSDFGATLREARERRGLTLRVIADATKISVRALEALERNDIARLPAGIFSRAFVRAYATEVGLDPEQTIAEFITRFPTDSVTQGHPRTRDIVAELEADARRRRWPTLGWMTLVGVPVLALAVYFGVVARRTPPVAVQPVSAATDHVLPASQPSAPEGIAVTFSASRRTTITLTIDGAAASQLVLEPGSPRDVVASRELFINPSDPLALQWTVNGEIGASAQRACSGDPGHPPELSGWAVSSPAPLLDFFRRGEVARDVRLLAAQGILAPRAHEQIAILILLVDDRDPEVRETATNTLNDIPVEALRAYLGRSDVPVAVREFFGDRGVFPAEIPAITADVPLFDVPQVEEAVSEDPLVDDDSTETLIQKLQKMGFTDRIRAAMRGSREMRAILVRDSNKMIAASVLSSPKVSDAEVESFAKMTTVSEDVLRTIAMNRAWLKNYGVVLALTKNPKTPVGLSLNLLNRLNDRDLGAVSNDRNVPDPLRTAARRKVVMGNKA